MSNPITTNDRDPNQDRDAMNAFLRDRIAKTFDRLDLLDTIADATGTEKVKTSVVRDLLTGLAPGDGVLL